jgi:hypothetical protein
MSGFITDTVLATAIANTLTKNVSADLVSAWGLIATQANAMAYADIYSILQSRGYTPTQIASWDHGVAFQTNQGLYWAFTYGASNHGEDDKWVEKWDMRKKLADEQFFLSINQVMTIPEYPDGAQVVVGGSMDQPCDRWKLPPLPPCPRPIWWDQYYGGGFPFGY